MKLGVDELNKVGLLIMITVIILLSACNDVSNDDNINDELWDSIVDTEFDAANYMGESIYFYEKDSVKYCDFWMSGSGVPVIFFHTSKIEFDEEGNIILETPTQFLGPVDFNNDLILETVTVEYTDEIISLNGIQYEDFDFNSREQALEWIGQQLD